MPPERFGEHLLVHSVGPLLQFHWAVVHGRNLDIQNIHHLSLRAHVRVLDRSSTTATFPQLVDWLDMLLDHGSANSESYSRSTIQRLLVITNLE